MQTFETIEWVVRASGHPRILKHCPKCGKESHYQNSEKFRVNANKKSLDIWLIYSCQRCDDTFNLAIFERIKPSSISAERLQAFMTNQAELACYYGLDGPTHKRAGVIQDFTQLEPDIQGPALSPQSSHFVWIRPQGNLELRLDWVLSQKLNLSRAQVKRLIAEGHIALTEGTCKKLENHKLKAALCLRIQSPELP